MNRLPRGATAALLGLSLAFLGSGTAHALPAPADAPMASDSDRVRLELPRPTGSLTVGRDTLHLVDTDRPDPWVPQAGARELMVSLYYPARSGRGRTAPYMTTDEARAFLEDRDLAGVVPAETLSGTRTHARVGATPVRGRFPLVVLSPGFTTNRSTLTLLAEELASRGYVVAAVDHAYESVGTTFPGNRLLTCAACDKVAEPDETVPRGRAQDVSFVLDRLTGRSPAWRHADMIDPTRIGMAGHSIGGASAASTMTGDQRVRAGVNLDGSFFDPVPAGGLGGRPFMVLGTEGEDATWVRDWPKLDGWKRWLTVAGSGHFTFTDVPVLADQLGLLPPEEPLSGERSQKITRRYVAAFFDLHLKGDSQPLLDGPSSQYPEVRIHRTS
ncbi:alpha/beta hydrolase family protein [Streptomyces spongiae]|uniref:Alpha/beta hydrolase n=1 Tax=Streptomyces spongiae TaxID=565072 RepID=A0A5N8XBC1_9ACTN|nr:alpha/beta hydrolase [Streptomyces spongiae]MPY56436.1 alpha/beta hydrolase [Streptomyces spongiae]